MNKVTKSLMKQAKKRGQHVKFFSDGALIRCPCWSAEFQQPDTAWHNLNPSEPNCNDDGYLPSTPLETEASVFVIPYGAASRREIPMYDSYLKQLGPIQQDDHILLAPDLPANTRRMEWSGISWHVYNPMPIPVGNETGLWLALVRGE